MREIDHQPGRPGVDRHRTTVDTVQQSGAILEDESDGRVESNPTLGDTSGQYQIFGKRLQIDRHIDRQPMRRTGNGHAGQGGTLGYQIGHHRGEGGHGQVIADSHDRGSLRRIEHHVPSGARGACQLGRRADHSHGRLHARQPLMGLLQVHLRNRCPDPPVRQYPQVGARLIISLVLLRPLPRRCVRRGHQADCDRHDQEKCGARMAQRTARHLPRRERPHRRGSDGGDALGQPCQQRDRAQRQDRPRQQPQRRRRDQ